MPDISLKLLVIKTQQMEAVVRFYSAIGFTFTEEQHGKGPIHWSAPLGDAILEIYPLKADRETDSSTRLGFAIGDPDEVVGQAEDLGGSVVKAGRDTPWGYQAIVSDPDGRVAELYRAS